ncbi:hypothetical protein NQ315_016135 [Exocentrus adspersus]|uniref:choline-phosphate cytidylyltransferase n=1 Tax=Exocentrus adspersus TaxID=1586481 RepID=A0AAV8V5S3_9CUCU|nr:hypothetical protein NQ315_016135 [Exocentrus adspersus]
MKTDNKDYIHHIINKKEIYSDEDEEYITASANYPFKRLRIYCDGIYDLFHYGHARSLQQAKNLFENTTLIVGIPSDKLTKELKGDLILSAGERIESLKHCKYVDEIIENAPWVVTPDYLEKYQIDFVAHDNAPYPGVNSEDIYEPLKRMNKFIPTKRTLGISTTGIITKLVKDYDRYVRRNLERGISAKDLNISILKKWDYHISKKFKSIKGNFKEEIDSIQKELSFALCYWEKYV